jgi:hypothetical protein
MSCSAELTCEEGAGAHTQDFWDVYLRQTLDRLDRTLTQGKQIQVKR